MARALEAESPFPLLRVEVHEPGVRPRKGWTACKIGENLKFSTEELASFCFAKWEPVVFDALLIAAVVEFCDRSKITPYSFLVRASFMSAFPCINHAAGIALRSARHFTKHYLYSRATDGLSSSCLVKMVSRHRLRAILNYRLVRLPSSHSVMAWTHALWPAW